MSVNDNSIGATIRQFRIDHNMTLKQMAEGAGMSISYMSDIERGRTNPSISALRQIAKALDIEPREIFKNDGALLDKDEIDLIYAWRIGDYKRILHMVADRIDNV